MVSQTSFLGWQVHDGLGLHIESAQMDAKVVIRPSFTSIAVSGLLLRSPNGQCFSGSLGNSGPLVHVSIGCRLGIPREKMSFRLLAEFTYLYSLALFRRV